MKKIILRQIAMLSRWTFYGILGQLIFTGVMLANHGHAQDVKSVRENYITIEFRNSSLVDAFSQLEEITGYHFAYENSRIDKKVRLNRRYPAMTSVSDILLDISELANVKFKQVNKTIIVSQKKGEIKEEEAIQVIIDGITITGRVTSSEDNSGLPGVSVIIKGTAQGTVTDIDGNYSINTAEGSTLVYSYVGFVSEEVLVGNQSVINIEMILDITSLQEIVVVGYGTQRKKDVTGAVATIASEDMNQGAFTNPLQQIAGRAAGVSVTQTSSEPGSSPSVRIRGITSLIGGNDPLVVVDGVQGNMDLLNQIPNSEIESIDVLKDASATAIYGSRGAPGVILVTTKKGKSGKVTVEYNGTASADFIPKELEVLNANQWWNEAQAIGVPPSANHGSSTDWFDILTKTGYTQNHTISFGGGSNSSNFRASVSAINQDGVVINSNNKKYIGSLSATQRALDDRLTLTMNLNSSINNTTSSPDYVGRASFTSNLITNAYVMRPTDPVYDVDGSTYYSDPNVFQYINPYAVAKTVVNEGRINSLFGTFRADLEVIDGLTVGWFGSWRKADNNQGNYTPEISTISSAIDNHGIANIGNYRQDERLMDVSLTYKRVIKDHSFNIFALYEAQSQTYQGNFTQAKGFINDIATYNALQLGSIASVTPGDFSSYKNDRSLVSYLGRLNYSYKERYLLTASVRRDGSSVFGSNHKWGVFPSVSVAWRIDQESFMTGQSLFDQLKLRGGYGVTGNQQGLYPQNSVSLVGSSGVTYFAGQETTNFGITQNSNPDLQWETRKQTNIGIEFGLINNRLSGSVDVYSGNTDNLLFNYTVPQPPYPYDQLTANVGSMLNKGIEVTLGYDLIKSTNTTLTLAGNVSFLRNEVASLNGTINGVPLNTNYVPWGPNAFLIEGEQIGTFNILQHTGVDENGAETVLDRDENGNIDQGVASKDRYLAGSALPTYTYAFTPTLKHKRFDFVMVWRGSGGNKVYNSLRQSLSTLEFIGRANVLQSAIPLGIKSTNYGSDVWLEDASFLRLDNMTLGYNFPISGIKYVEKMRLSLTGNNLMVITKYKGSDPEINVNGANGFGGDNGYYPRVRSIAVGLVVILK